MDKLPNDEDIVTAVNVLELLGKNPDHNLFKFSDESMGKTRKCSREIEKTLKDIIIFRLHRAISIVLKQRKGFLRTVRRQKRHRDKIIQNTSGIRLGRAMKRQKYVDKTPIEQKTDYISPPTGQKFHYLKRCYVCKKSYNIMHTFYCSLCIKCGDFNFSKRTQYVQVNLDNCISIVTGGRVKIGYEIALMLLRSSCTTIVTTRFPNDCALRFKKEKDYNTFNHHLHIASLDLRFLDQINTFCDFISTNFASLFNKQNKFILINNAAQTIRKPPVFYSHLIANESVSPVQLGIVSDVFCKVNYESTLLIKNDSSLSTSSSSISHSSQIALIPSDRPGWHNRDVFPINSFDENGQQIDLRETNTWVLKADQINPIELLEVHIINSMAPFCLITRLKSFMSQFKTSYIINVTAVEGQFDVNCKRSGHPHTNMAKASFNMLTRTSASDFAKSNIFMNSVDTGWVTNNFPKPDNSSSQSNIIPMLDCIDGAARVLDPIFTSIITKKNSFGILYKDYAPAPW